MSLSTENAKSLPIGNTRLLLLPEKALYWEQAQALILTDPHFGKTGHFRKYGIPVPRAAEESDYQVLATLLASYAVRDVYFLGDLFHSSENKDWELFAGWLKQYPEVTFRLIPGNHDILSAGRYREVGLHLAPPGLSLPPFRLTHEPDSRPERQTLINLAGHVHPSVQLRGKGRMQAKLPCFYYAHHQLILPAFGRFTGTHPLKPKANDRVFTVAEAGVWEV